MVLGGVSGFNDTMPETFQLACGGEALSCPPNLKVNVKATFATPSDSLSLPGSAGIAIATTPAALISKLNPPFDRFLRTKLEIEQFTKFELETLFRLFEGSEGINPSRDVVMLMIGPRQFVFPPFRKHGGVGKGEGELFTFEGAIRNVRLHAMFKPRDTVTPHRLWEFKVEGDGVDLRGTTNPVRVQLSIGHDTGKTLVTAKIEERERR